jgi:hypothetical protein
VAADRVVAADRAVVSNSVKAGSCISVLKNIKCNHCAKIENNVNDMVKSLKDMLKGENINMLNIVGVCLDMMKIVSKLDDVTEEQRKEMVVQVLTIYLHENDGDVTLVEMVPSFMDAAVAISEGKVKVAVENVQKGCFAWLFSKKVKKVKNKGV